jgi:hypothetical protein
MQSISDYDLAIWITAVTNTNYKEFLRRYNEYLKDESNDKAPLYSQRLATFIGYSVVTSNDNSLYEKLCSIIKNSNNKTITSVDIFYCSAVGGAGKSSVIAKTIYELTKNESKIGILCPNDGVSKRLIKTLGVSTE